jgi:hypothetical protein
VIEPTPRVRDMTNDVSRHVSGSKMRCLDKVVGGLVTPKLYVVEFLYLREIAAHSRSYHTREVVVQSRRTGKNA